MGLRVLDVLEGVGVVGDGLEPQEGCGQPDQGVVIQIQIDNIVESL